MEQERFLEACRWATSRENTRQGIGTLGEKTLHSAVKYYFQPDPDMREVPVGPFVADALVDGGVVEVQTRSLYRLCPKLDYFLSQGKATVVYPVPAKKTVVWISPEGDMTPPRKSPLKPTAGQVLPELYGLREFLGHPGFSLCVLLLEVEDYRLLNGWGRDKKRGSTRYERMPVSLLQEVWVRSPGEYGKLIPESLPPLFTSRELGRAVGVPSKRASSAANVLLRVGAIRREGKRGGAYLYTRAGTPCETAATGG